jgi:hypothetical protein
VGPESQDTHAAVGRQVTLESLGTASPGELALLSALITLADTGAIDLVAKGRSSGVERGWAYLGGGTWQSDRAAEQVATGALQALATPGSELSFTAVPAGTATRIGIDRDRDGALDRDELEAGTWPHDPASTPGPCADPAPAAPTGPAALRIAADAAELTWSDASAVEAGFTVERASAGSGSWETVAELPADSVSYVDVGLACDGAYDYRVSARGCGGSASAQTSVSAGTCPSLTADREAVSLLFGGTQTLALDAGAAHASEIHLLLGSATGISPGLSGGGLHLPLNYDLYMDLTLNLPNTLPLGNSLGVLDGSGRATSTFSLPPGFIPTLAGATLHHAFIALDPVTLAGTFASNAVPVRLTP